MDLVAFDRAFRWLKFDTLGVFMRLIVSSVFTLEKFGNIWGNQPFFQANTVRLGKYCMGCYSWVGVYIG